MGMMVELLLASLALLVWLNVETGLVSGLAYKVMLIGGISTLLFNGNPLMRYDGYYMLADLIEIPNLGQRSTRYLGLSAAALPAGNRNSRIAGHCARGAGLVSDLRTDRILLPDRHFARAGLDRQQSFLYHRCPDRFVGHRQPADTSRAAQSVPLPGQPGGPQPAIPPGPGWGHSYFGDCTADICDPDAALDHDPGGGLAAGTIDDSGWNRL